MSVRFAKVLAHARPPEKLNVNDPGATIFSAENFNVAYSEVHGYRTGIALEVPEGKIVQIVENAGMGIKGVTVAGGVLTSNHVGEVRVNLINSHREAFEIKAGDPLGFILLLDSPTAGDEYEEYDLEGLGNEMKEASAEAYAESQKLKADKRAKAAAEEAAALK